jgi:hypothetical protein
LAITRTEIAGGAEHAHHERRSRVIAGTANRTVVDLLGDGDHPGNLHGLSAALRLRSSAAAPLGGR